MYLLQVFFVLFATFWTTAAIVLPQGSENKPPTVEDASKSVETKKIPVINLSQSHRQVVENSSLSHAVTGNTVSPVVNKSTESRDRQDSGKFNKTLEDKTSVESGAVTRAIFVFVGISLLFILYVGFKTYRSRTVDKSRVLVRKYGVRSRRTDIEMEPLPLSDDEDDETVFDLTATRAS